MPTSFIFSVLLHRLPQRDLMSKRTSKNLQTRPAVPADAPDATGDDCFSRPSLDSCIELGMLHKLAVQRGVHLRAISIQAMTR